MTIGTFQELSNRLTLTPPNTPRAALDAAEIAQAIPLVVEEIEAIKARLDELESARKSLGGGS